jgi:hypothetical protein
MSKLRPTRFKIKSKNNQILNPSDYEVKTFGTEPIFLRITPDIDGGLLVEYDMNPIIDKYINNGIYDEEYKFQEKEEEERIQKEEEEIEKMRKDEENLSLNVDIEIKTNEEKETERNEIIKDIIEELKKEEIIKEEEIEETKEESKEDEDEDDDNSIYSDQDFTDPNYVVEEIFTNENQEEENEEKIINEIINEDESSNKSITEEEKTEETKEKEFTDEGYRIIKEENIDVSEDEEVIEKMDFGEDIKIEQPNEDDFSKYILKSTKGKILKAEDYGIEVEGYESKITEIEEDGTLLLEFFEILDFEQQNENMKELIQYENHIIQSFDTLIEYQKIFQGVAPTKEFTQLYDVLVKIINISIMENKKMYVESSKSKDHILDLGLLNFERYCKVFKQLRSFLIIVLENENSNKLLNVITKQIKKDRIEDICSDFSTEHLQTYVKLYNKINRKKYEKIINEIEKLLKINEDMIEEIFQQKKLFQIKSNLRIKNLGNQTVIIMLKQGHWEGFKIFVSRKIEIQGD